MRYFTGDFVAAAHFLMRYLEMPQDELAWESRYSPSYLSGLLNRKLYSPK